jgi:tol-pal system protein YbgF
LVSASAYAGLFDDEEARKDLRNLRLQVEQQSRDNEAKFQALDEAIKNIGIIQLLNQIELQNAEISRLRGQLEVLANQNDQLSKRQKDFYLDIDTRLRKLETPPAEAAAAPVLLPAAEIPLPNAPASPSRPLVAAVSREQESRAYDVGSNLFKRGDYAEAARAFEQFKSEYPGSALAPNALYWIGICHFNLKDFANARAAQESLMRTYPDSAKVPDALLAVASVQAETGDAGSAKNTLEDIIARFPGSEAAAKARARLNPLRR